MEEFIVQDLRGHGLCRKPGQGRRPKEEYSQVGFHRVNCFWRMAVLQAIWRIKSLGLVKLICLLTPHGKGYFVCAKPKVVGVQCQWSKCVQCSVVCKVYSVQCALEQNKFTFSEMVVLPDSFSACYTLLATV